MTSSTSPFEPRIPRRALALLILAVTTWAACAGYSLWLNPENQFMLRVSAVQGDWAAKLQSSGKPKAVIFGGSSTLFSIRGEQLLSEVGLPAVNCGLPAALGPTVHAIRALQYLGKDDTLVVAIEPDLLTDRLEITSSAVQFSYASGHPEWVRESWLGQESRSSFSSLLALRPGSSHTLTMVGKILSGMPLYRYRASDISPTGWVQTSVRLPLVVSGRSSSRLSNDAERLLAGLRDVCAQRGVRVAYSIPWCYTPREVLIETQRTNAAFLRNVAEFLPVLHDARFGAIDDPELFSDTALHLNENGSVLRTRELGIALRDWRLWNGRDFPPQQVAH